MKIPGFFVTVELIKGGNAKTQNLYPVELESIPPGLLILSMHSVFLASLVTLSDSEGERA
jgi:hypothetical protein